MQCTIVGVNIHGCMHHALSMVIFFLPSFSMFLLLTWVQFCAKCDFIEWLSLRLKQYPASLGQHDSFDQVSPWAPCRVKSFHHRKPKVLCSRLGWVMKDDLEHVTTHILLKVWRGPLHVTTLVWHIATKNCVSWVFANGKWAATQFASLFILDHVGDFLFVS